MEDHEKLTNKLDEAHADFHTYLRAENRYKKSVLKAAPNMELKDIKTGVSEYNVDIKEIVPLRRRSDALFSWLITLPREAQINDIKKMNKIGNVKVT